MLISLKKITLICLLPLCTACADVTVHGVDPARHDINLVCLQQRSRAVPAEFKYILKESFMRHDIVTKTYRKDSTTCSYRLSYFVKAQVKRKNIYLKDVHLALYKGSELIGFADRDAPKGFFGKEVGDLSRWDSPRSIIEPLVDQLLSRVRTYESSNKLKLTKL